MNRLIASNSSVSMSSIDFLNEIINPSREFAGENPVRPSDFHSRVNDEIDDVLNYENFVVGKTGHKTHYTMLSMEQMMLVGMRESKAVRRSVLEKLKRMQSPAIPDFSNPADAARAWADEFEQRKIAEEKLLIAAPKAEFVDKYVDATGLMGFREVAKLLKVKETKLRDFVLENKIMYRLSGRMTPYAQHIDAGRFSVKTGEADNGHAFTQSKFTPKGVNWIAELLNGVAS